MEEKTLKKGYNYQNTWSLYGVTIINTDVIERIEQIHLQELMLFLTTIFCASEKKSINVCLRRKIFMFEKRSDSKNLSSHL